MRAVSLGVAFVVLATAAVADDVTLSVAITPTATTTCQWSALAMPPGAVAPRWTSSGPASTTAVASWATDAVPGTYVLQAVVRDGTALVATSQTAIQVTRSQTIVFPNTATTYRLTPGLVIDPQATTTAPGLGVVYRLEGSAAVATLVDGRLVPVGPGSVQVIADVAPHTPVRYRSQPVAQTYSFTTASLLAQTISVPSTSRSVVLGSTPTTLTLGATASSGLPLAYTSSAPTIATVAADGTVTITTATTADITITQAGSDQYAAAAPVVVRVVATAPAPVPGTGSSGSSGSSGSGGGGGGGGCGVGAGLAIIALSSLHLLRRRHP